MRLRVGSKSARRVLEAAGSRGTRWRAWSWHEASQSAFGPQLGLRPLQHIFEQRHGIIILAGIAVGIDEAICRRERFGVVRAEHAAGAIPARA